MSVDLTPIITQYAGEWVALDDDEQTVLAHGCTVHEVLYQARRQGYEKPILFRVPTRVDPGV